MTKSTGKAEAHRLLTPPQAFLKRLVQGQSDQCWEWSGTRIRSGYGVFKHHKKEYYTHRMAYEAFIGPVGKMHVLHQCDNPPCCNPAHLRLGTHQDNMREAVERRRMNRDPKVEGTDHPLAKLNEDDVRIIRASQEAGNILAKRYGVAKSLISRVRLRQSWKHVA